MTIFFRFGCRRCAGDPTRGRHSFLGRLGDLTGLIFLFLFITATTQAGWIKPQTTNSTQLTEVDPFWTAFKAGELITIGNNAQGSGDAVAIGTWANSDVGGFAVGTHANGSTYGAALGYYAVAANYGAALGYGSTGVNKSVALGYCASATNYAVAIGDGAAAGHLGVAIGQSATAHKGGTAVGLGSQSTNYGASLGNAASAHNYGAAVGLTAQAGSYGAAVGYSACASTYGAAIGAYANAEQYGASLGSSANGKYSGIALGYYANAPLTNIAVGYMAYATGGPNRVAIGRDVHALNDEAVTLRGTVFLDGGTAVLYRATFGTGAWSNLLTGANVESATSYVHRAGDSMTGNLNLGGNKLTNVILTSENAGTNVTITADGKVNAAGGSETGTLQTAMNRGSTSSLPLMLNCVMPAGTGTGIVIQTVDTQLYYPAIAIGPNHTNNFGGIVIGRACSADNYGIAIGGEARASSKGIAIGGYEYGGEEAIAGSNCISIGFTAVSTVNGIAIGRNASASAGGASIGFTSEGGELGATLGYQANSYVRGAAVGYLAKGPFYGAALGSDANAANYGAALGFFANGNAYGAALGAYAEGCGVGYWATGNGYGAALGREARGDTFGVAIGAFANGQGTNIAIGPYAKASGGSNRTVIGSRTTNLIDDSAVIRGTLYLDGGSNVFYRDTFGAGAWNVLGTNYVKKTGDAMTGALQVGGAGLLQLIGSGTPQLDFVDVSAVKQILRLSGDNNLYFSYATAASNNMRLDSVGNLYVSNSVNTPVLSYSDTNVWEDLLFPASAFDPVGAAGKATLGYAYGPSDDLMGLEFAQSEDQIAVGRVQMPHKWRTTQPDVYLHVHWFPETTATGTVSFEVRYTEAGIGGYYHPTRTNVLATGCTNERWRHKMATFPAISLTNGTTVSHGFSMVIVRPDADDGDTYVAPVIVTDFDVHIRERGSPISYVPSSP